MKFEDCRFGQVVRYGSYGIGVIYALVPKNSSVLCAFELECVNTMPAGLELLGDIRIFEAVPLMARAAKAEADIGRNALPEN